MDAALRPHPQRGEGIPGVRKIHAELAAGDSAVRADGSKKLSHSWGSFLVLPRNRFIGFQNPLAHEFEPLVAFARYLAQFFINRLSLGNERILTLMVLAQIKRFRQVSFSEPLELYCFSWVPRKRSR
ncbi:MAG: hypothetical protein AAB647_03475 [Patescibacteria group bacterium]